MLMQRTSLSHPAATFQAANFFHVKYGLLLVSSPEILQDAQRSKAVPCVWRSRSYEASSCWSLEAFLQHALALGLILRALPRWGNLEKIGLRCAAMRNSVPPRFLHLTGLASPFLAPPPRRQTGFFAVPLAACSLSHSTAAWRKHKKLSATFLPSSLAPGRVCVCAGGQPCWRSNILFVPVANNVQMNWLTFAFCQWMGISRKALSFL